MVRNIEKLEQAVQLRARGFTLEEIAKYVAVSKSTVSKWLKNNATSAEITKQNKRRAGQENAKRLQLMSKTRTRERSLRYKEAELSAETEFKHYKKNPLFIAGLISYASLGDVTEERSIRLTTARIVVHKTFISFAVEYLGVPKNKIKLWLLLYTDHNEETCMRKWQKVTTLPYSQFHKNQIIKGKPKHKTLHHGVGNTIIGSTVLKRKLIRWIELMHKELTIP
jgi:transcriptional regulator with XRE-family HTH domain